jgi:serine protease Do
MDGRSRKLGLCHILITLAATLVFSLSAAVAEDPGPNRSSLIHSLLPAVVNITVQKEATVAPNAATAAASLGPTFDSTKSFVGAGFIIDPTGTIVTNYHVVEGAFEIAVTLADGAVLPGKILHASRLADLAVLQVQPDHLLAAAQWGDSTKLRVGDQVFAIGNPLGIGTSVTGGIISGLNRDVQDSPYDDYIQTDAAINHGNSGGPLFNMEGQVIGVNTALVSPTDASAGLGMAIPAAHVRFVIERLEKYGWIRPGWMCVTVQQMTREMADAMGFKQPVGSVVAWVEPNGPANKAGIVIDDVIAKFGDDIQSDERALLRDISKTPVGNTVQVTVLRDGAPRSLPVTIAAWPRGKWDERDAPMAAQRPKLTVPRNLGLSLSTIEDSQHASLDLEPGMSGVLVTGVLPGSDAAHRGLTSGDIILRVQNTPVTNPIDVQHGIDAARDNQRLYVMMLVLPKVRKIGGPRWQTLRLTGSDA